MSQQDIGTIDPTETSGSELAALLTAWGAAQQTNNIGAARPSYAAAGTIWVASVSSTNHTVYYYDGVHDVPLFVVNPSAGTCYVFQAAQAAVAASLVESVGGTAALAARLISTQHSLTGGGNLTADRTLSLVGDTATPGATKYYGTNGSGTRGWNSFPTPAKQMRKQTVWTTPGTYTWTAPVGVNWVWLTGIAGCVDDGLNNGDVPASAGFDGGLAVIAGETYNLQVGTKAPVSSTAEATTSFYTVSATGTTVGGGGYTAGTTTIPGGSNISAVYPKLAYPFDARRTYGESGTHGFLRVEWIE